MLDATKAITTEDSFSLKKDMSLAFIHDILNDISMRTKWARFVSQVLSPWVSLILLSRCSKLFDVNVSLVSLHEYPS